MHKRLVAHVSERYLHALKAICHIPPASHRACRMHIHLKVGDFQSTLSRQHLGQLRAVEDLLDVCNHFVQSALCSFVRTHPIFNLQRVDERARQNEANLLTENCLDPCPAFEQERRRATHCLQPLAHIMESGEHFNASGARQQWVKYAACAPGTPRTTEAVIPTCYELSRGDREAQRNLRRGEHPVFKAFSVCMNDGFSGKTQWDVRLHALYAVATNPVGCFVLLVLCYVIIRCYGFDALLTCVLGISCSGFSWSGAWRILRGWCRDVAEALAAVVTRIHLQGSCYWLKALMTCKAMTGGVCLVAAGVYSVVRAFLRCIS